MVDGISLVSGSVAVLASLCAALAGLRFLEQFPFRGHARAPAADAARAFLFEGTRLIDASPDAEQLLGHARAGQNDWARMLSALALHFPDLPDRLSGLDDRGTVGVRSTDGAWHLIASAIGRRVRVVLTEGKGPDNEISVDPLVFRSMTRELDTLRCALDAMPFLVWRQTNGGQVIWANRAYMELTGEDAPQPASEYWPQPSLFDLEELSELVQHGAARRLSPHRPGSSPAPVFECRTVPVQNGHLFSAVRIDATIEAETQLRNFMQTLTKTFSHLATGLAIFDRRRRLAVFNPALTDLTGLPVDFLAARPTLYSVLDRLRDHRMIPEPKDYGSWRRQIARLEAAALDGTYAETWSLPDNRTYRVTGRPHHGGAIALLIEDISSEVTLTRRFRTELELGQAVIDALDAAVVVFSPTGQVSMVNTGYQELWSSDIADTVEAPTVTELSREWMARAASPVWGDIREFVLHESERTAWEAEIQLPGGDPLECRIAPLAGGSTLVSFKSRGCVPGKDSEPRAAG